LQSGNFRVEMVERMSFADASFDVVISSAVLHFARDEEHWQSMVWEMWRILRRGGIFFARLASSIGIEERVEQLEGQRYRLPDGSDRFLVDERMLLATTDALGGELLEPLKSVVVQNMRSMATWCVRKS
jgi:ubiquinone/menaquinone biosynthesis C-methylase UbiE